MARVFAPGQMITKEYNRAAPEPGGRRQHVHHGRALRLTRLPQGRAQSGRNSSCRSLKVKALSRGASARPRTIRPLLLRSIQRLAMALIGSPCVR